MSHSSSMTCVILVAGHNNALEDEVRKLNSPAEAKKLKGVPKALLPVPGRNGKPESTILDLWWNDLKERRQFSTVYLVTNADKYKHFERWATASDFPVENIINDGTTTHESRIGAVADLNLVLQTKQITGDVMVVSGDMLTSDDFDITGVKRFFDHQGGDLCIYYELKPGEQPETRGMIEIDEKTKRVTRFAEKPLDWPTRLATVVFYCFKNETCSEIPQFMAQHSSVEERSFGKLMEYLVPRGNVFGMKVPTQFKLVGPKTTLSEYLAIRDSISGQECKVSDTFTSRAYARVGLMGNPSDGFNGKTIALSIKNFWAEVTITESERLRLLPHPVNDPNEFGGLNDLFLISNKEGYVGGLRLMQATCKKFYEYCTLHGIALSKKNFTLSYDTNIPRQVGLAGSSCIVVACIKALMHFYGLSYSEIPQPLLPRLVLSVEAEELFITAGLQDRVVQVYEGLVYMDFSKELVDSQGHGNYERLKALPPPLFLLYASDPSDSGRIHSNIKERWSNGDPDVVDAMNGFAKLTDMGKEALLQGDHEKFGQLMDANFNLRREIYGDDALGSKNLAMIELGRSFGAHMKFPGSGGACVGMLRDPSQLEPLSLRAQQLGFVCVPLHPHFPSC